MLDAIRRDFSFTARSLRRAPTFSVTVVLILGLAIGMSSAMLTVFRSVLLERLPVKQQDRIVELSGLAGGAASEVPISPAQVRRFREQSRTLDRGRGARALARHRRGARRRRPPALSPRSGRHRRVFQCARRGSHCSVACFERATRCRGAQTRRAPAFPSSSATRHGNAHSAATHR